MVSIDEMTAVGLEMELQWSHVFSDMVSFTIL